MTDLRQAAQQALEALENSSPDQYPEDAGVFYDAITALRTALEQQAEPVYQIKVYGSQTAWHDAGLSAYVVTPSNERRILYTTPPQRQWVGLTHEQTKDCLKAWDENDAYALCRAIEAKLRSKNDR